MFSKILNFAGIGVLILMVKMFFFSAFFMLAGNENIPQNIYEYSHTQYSSTEKLKRIREVNLDEWLEANVHVESAKFFFQKLTSFVCNFQVYQLFSFTRGVGKTGNVSHFCHNLNLSAILNNRSYLRFQKLIL